MGKRTRQERKAHQREQALATGDITKLREIVEKTPLAAVPDLVRALGDPPADPALAAELEALALRLARRLRHGGEPERALTVAAAAQRRTSAWSMEEALAAFALGRDEVAAAVVAAELHEWMGKVNCYTSEKLEAAFPARWQAELSVRLSNGTVIDKFEDAFRGSPAVRATWADVVTKAEGLLGIEAAAALAVSIDVIPGRLPISGQIAFLQHIPTETL